MSGTPDELTISVAELQAELFDCQAFILRHLAAELVRMSAIHGRTSWTPEQIGEMCEAAAAELERQATNPDPPGPSVSRPRKDQAHD